MSTPAASAPYGGDRPTIENRKLSLRRANVAYRSREYLSDKEVIPSYIFRGDGQVIDLDAIVAGGVVLTEFSGIWAYSPLLAAFASGAAKPPAGVEENYAKSQLEWVQQTYDGRMDYGAVATSTVQDLLGRPAMTLREWAPRHREALLAAASKADD